MLLSGYIAMVFEAQNWPRKYHFDSAIMKKDCSNFLMNLTK